MLLTNVISALTEEHKDTHTKKKLVLTNVIIEERILQQVLHSHMPKAAHIDALAEEKLHGA